MKILVTGGAGFIGSHLVNKYVELGHKVSVIDIAPQNYSAKVAYHRADIRNYEQIHKIIRKEKPDIISHQAALSSVLDSMKNPRLTYETNILGTLNLLRAARRTGVKKFIFASTGGAVYGNKRKIPVAETRPLKPVSPYGQSKAMAENHIKLFADYFDYLILRYGNVYGPQANGAEVRGRGVIDIFAAQMRSGQTSKIYGRGNKTRDYVFIDDVINANILALRHGKNETLNIGTGKETTDLEIYNLIGNELNFKQKPILAPHRPGEVSRVALDCKKAEKIMGWRSNIPLKTGLSLTLEPTKEIDLNTQRA